MEERTQITQMPIRCCSIRRRASTAVVRRHVLPAVLSPLVNWSALRPLLIKGSTWQLTWIDEACAGGGSVCTGTCGCGCRRRDWL